MKPQVTKLQNNFRIITDTMTNVESVVMHVWTNVGSRYEEKEKIGLSHFLEHMAFKGTKTRSAFDIAKIFDDIGGNFNAHTDRENTVYHVKVLKRDIKIAIEVLADIIINSQIPQDEIEREKGVVLQEIYQTNDSPSSIIFDKYIEAAYSNQPFGRPILGSLDTVKKFSREDISSYMNKYYHGDNMLLAVAGNVTHKEIVEISSPYFSQVNSHHCPKPKPSNYTGGEYLETRDLEQVNLVIGFPGISYTDEKYHAIQIFDSILGGGMSSRLFQRVREQLGLAYSISSFNSSYSDTGIFSVYASTETSNLQKLLSTIVDEIKKTTTDLTEEEVKRAKGKIESEILMSREGTYSRAESLGYYYSHYDRYITKEELLDKFSTVSLAHIKQCIDHLLQNHKKITLAAIGKLETLPSYSKIVDMLKQ